jgi:aldehyde:ferredoxin oxidoreductase
MDPEDIRLAMDMYYREMGWDEKSGSPTEVSYRRHGLTDVYAELEKRGLVP